MGQRLVIAGVGPGDGTLVSERAKRRISTCDCLIAGKRILEQYAEIPAEKIEVGNNLEEICRMIRENWQRKKIVVAASGDPFLFGIGSYLYETLPDIPKEAVSGISAASYLAAKTGRRLEQFAFYSVHGRAADVPAFLAGHPATALFCGKEAERVLSALTDCGMGDVQATAGEALSYPEERIRMGTAEALSKEHFSDLTLLFLERGEGKRVWPYVTGGICDSVFARNEVPLTKEEVRAVSVAKLRLLADSVLLDIGAGTGGVSVEAALHMPLGRVLALEKNPAALRLLEENCKRFGTANVQAIPGRAEETIKCLPIKPDRVFVGGTGGSMKEILSAAAGFAPVRVVVNTVMLESGYFAAQALQELGFSNIEWISLAVSKAEPLGGGHMLKAQNAVMVLSAEKGMDG